MTSVAGVLLVVTALLASCVVFLYFIMVHAYRILLVLQRIEERQRNAQG